MARYKVTVEIETPRVPNFLKMSDGQMIPVEAITEDGLRQIGASWTEDLVAHAKKRAAENRATGEGGRG